ncbi:methionine--tRNA ligase [Flavobacteriaceae bacterium]|jgi:methionyl-tRNA synthetase|nr:methionine--tRNA ligase [Flavobacteriaceae bacterium]MDA8644554.1 methionine--tRNA ligase [Flavobacteriaceae bacterium]MDA9037815.1 methionine--tRNA ligase [Flavobacteriaceae bacterium]MDA9851636.1 methionine--tRNA ligase [Flavobacteriaceae bacterium]MDC0872807.1 methionine--tRNA ligase [Flavobacteriaceae bacterium]
MPKRYTITAALPYTNGPIHIGHLAGVYVPADIYARYLRGQGKDVAFICGSDEHGVAISLKAKKEGKTPQEVIDQYDQLIRTSFKKFGIEFDNYSRTSRAIHHNTAQEIFSDLYQKGIFEEKETEQLFDPEANQFLADRYVTGTCPICQHPEAYGDQCENCGSSLSATELINPQSTISGSQPEMRKTKHWYLPLNQYEAFLKSWILEGHQSDWKPNVYGQVKSWIDNGLQPRAVTRDLDWGIPVPVSDANGKVLYVWFDAPIGYISSTKEWAAEKGKDWEPYWKDKDTQLVHFIGKDNIVFHCIIFPVMLHASGDYILPENVPANEFLNLEGQKISTSKNWAVWLHEYLEAFPDQQDVLRYVLTANAPETKDNDFTWEEFQARNNNELVAIYGNFINRVVVLTHKYYDGVVPSPESLFKEDQLVLDAMKLLPNKIGHAITQYRFREASQLLMQLARIGNKYLADAEPWKQIKTDPVRVTTIMHTALQISAGLAVLSEPFLPHTAKKLTALLQLEKLQLKWDDVNQKEELIPTDHKIEKAQLLFQKIEDVQMDEQRAKLASSAKQNQSETQIIAPLKPQTTFENFTALDLKVAQIIEAKKVDKTKKLMELKVQLGNEIRTVVSGIAQDFDAAELIGKKVTLLTNLAPRTLKGIESNGMILLGENKQGHFVFVHPEDESVQNGTEIH